MKKHTAINPNHAPKNMSVLITISSKPRYIGFLVYEKIPVVIRVVVSSGFIGLIVVLFFLNREMAEIAVKNPNTKTRPPIAF
tara:strand:+ start:375 stop:620 length:246 start_codon:yes stop_codon:yes gene_type:complete